MARDTDQQAVWLEAIARSLAYLCLAKAQRDDPKRAEGVLGRVRFLTELGLPKDAASYAAGSTPASVTELERQKRAKEKPRGTKKRANKKKRGR